MHFKEPLNKQIFDYYLHKSIVRLYDDQANVIEGCLDGEKLIVYFDILDESLGKNIKGELIFRNESIKAMRRTGNYDPHPRSVARILVAFILGCQAGETKKLVVNLQCSVVTLESEGQFFTFPITSFFDKVTQKRTWLTDDQKKLINEVIDLKRWTRDLEPEDEPEKSSLVNKLDVPSQIINLLHETFQPVSGSVRMQAQVAV
eukprot:GHVT01023694.1.p1 GENE.GHVT01023694.1~~GHVT01023694.1.p1  ORF type:complete len:203 (-),score=21.24 GHVT01023694.1:104-712(-)